MHSSTYHCRRIIVILFHIKKWSTFSINLKYLPKRILGKISNSFGALTSEIGPQRHCCTLPFLNYLSPFYYIHACEGSMKIRTTIMDCKKINNNNNNECLMRIAIWILYHKTTLNNPRFYQEIYKTSSILLMTIMIMGVIWTLVVLHVTDWHILDFSCSDLHVIICGILELSISILHLIISDILNLNYLVTISLFQVF